MLVYAHSAKVVCNKEDPAHTVIILTAMISCLFWSHPRVGQS